MNRATGRYSSQVKIQALPCTSFPRSSHPYRNVFSYLDRLVAIGKLKKNYHSEWATPSFIIPKKGGQVRLISDFRRLNDQIKCTLCPLPHIKDMLNKLSNFYYSTTLDLKMGYYNIFLTDAANKLCMITKPFGKY